MTHKIPYIAVCTTSDDAQSYAKEFIIEHNTVISTDKRNNIFRVTLKDGNEYFFMSYLTYKKWCMGRTYKYIGNEDLWHSGYRVRENENSN